MTKLKKISPFPLLNILGGFLAYLIPAFNFAEGFKANVSNVTIGYNESMKIKVGPYDTTTGEMKEPDYFWFLNVETVSYSVEFPDGNPGGAWFVDFNPSLRMKTRDGGVLNSTATISLRPSPISTEPVQNTLIRIKFTDSWTIGDIWRIERQFRTANMSFFFVHTWPLAALVDGFGKWSGTTILDEYTYDIVAKVKTHHQVTFQELGLQELRPNQITSIPISVTNRGNYNDSIGFYVTSGNGTHLRVIGNNTIALTPGQQGNTLIAVSVPPDFLDTGTLQSLKIQAYSTEQPNIIIGEQTIPLITQGLYVSPMTGIGIIGAGIVLLILIIILFLLLRRLQGKNYKKPEKPWTIPSEKEHLDTLKHTDPEAYERERTMMAQEYESALLWFNGYKKTIRTERHKKTTKTPKTTTITKRTITKITTLLHRRPKTEKKAKPPKVKPVKTKKQPITPETTDRERQKAMQRVLKEQKRQARLLRRT